MDSVHPGHPLFEWMVLGWCQIIGQKRDILAFALNFFFENMFPDLVGFQLIQNRRRSHILAFVLLTEVSPS